MRRYARIGRAVTVLAVVALGAQAAPASAGKHKRKPDLYVRSALFGPVGEDHALRGEDNVLQFEAETQNRGKGAAKPSKTEIVFVPIESDDFDFVDGKRIHAFSLNVGRIRGYTYKYFSDFGKATSPPLTFNGYPLGTYEAFWCADAENKVKESNERNNCVAPGGDLQRLYLGKRTWTGTVSGTGPVGQEPTSVHEDWSSTGGSLELWRVGEGGIFHYRFNGTVTWTIGGGTEAHGCSYSGSGSDSIVGGPGNQDFTIDYVDGEYGGDLISDLDDTYPISEQCPTSSDQIDGPIWVGFFNTLVDGNTLPLPFGTEVLAGTNYDVIDRATWTWDFR